MLHHKSLLVHILRIYTLLVASLNRDYHIFGLCKACRSITHHMASLPPIALVSYGNYVDALLDSSGADCPANILSI